MRDQYIKMVLALPAEFFTGWKWQAGDRAISMNSFRELIIVSTRDEYQNLLPGRFDAIFFDQRCTQEVNKNWLMPLPSQKQLQSMLNLNPIEFIEDFYEYAQEPLLPGMDNEQFKTDLDCFTLAYVVDRKFKKFWDGEKWL